LDEAGYAVLDWTCAHVIQRTFARVPAGLDLFHGQWACRPIRQRGIAPSRFGMLLPVSRALSYRAARVEWNN
jgi:hypothetical protein